ncbi:RDD family protein [Mycoplasma sp. E35C]|uniref:RDD family protein n=1 Tax=Mycoplasma sp. E35C TaxID=2801918 RepID=UPI001CA43284|nr:RDD family protein [Mycoplasma sp. E35C]QZX49463.1 RDD family protein [Mycoplasma sp. E35C]
MDVIFYNQQKNIKEKYEPAKASLRIFAGLFDLFFVSLITFGVNYLINFLFDKYWTDYLISVFFIVVAINTFILFSLYFVLIPYLTKGKTLFRLAFKIQLIERQEYKKYIGHLFLHNLLIYGLLVGIILLMGISLFAFDKKEQIRITNLFLVINILNQPIHIIIFISIFRGFYSIYALILFIIFASIIVRSKKIALHDSIAHLVMIDLKTKVDLIKINEPITPSKIEINLPGNFEIES